MADGATGYFDGGHIQRPLYCEGEEFVDFKTGERYSRSYEKEGDFVFITPENGYLTVDIDGAYVITTNLQPGKEYWNIDGRLYGMPNKPLVDFYSYETYVDSYSDNGLWEVTEAEYTDFENIDCLPTFDEIDFDQYTFFHTIEPYSGFYPSMLSEEYSYDGWGSQEGKKITAMRIYPVQYDYENKVMRAYRHIKFRRTDTAGVANIAAEDADAIYYTLDGRLEPSPKHGTLYIRKSGDSFEKIIF